MPDRRTRIRPRLERPPPPRRGNRPTHRPDRPPPPTQRTALPRILTGPPLPVLPPPGCTDPGGVVHGHRADVIRTDESLVPVPCRRPGRVRRTRDSEPEPPQFLDRYLWPIPHSGRRLRAAPLLPSRSNFGLPTFPPRHAAVPDEELDEVLDTRAKAVPAGRNMDRLNRCGCRVPGLGQQVGEKPAFGVYVDMRTRHSVGVADVLDSRNRLLATFVQQLKCGLVHRKMTSRPVERELETEFHVADRTTARVRVDALLISERIAAASR